MDGMPPNDGELPFGYNANGIHGIGLPPYATQPMYRPHPPSQPILSEQNNDYLNDFWRSFDQPQPSNDMNDLFLPDHTSQMPPSYAGFESIVYDKNGQEIHEHQIESFRQNNQLPHFDVHSLPQLGQHDHYPYMSPSGPSFGLPTPVHSHSYQQQPYQPQGQPLPTPGRGPVPNFGSDGQFSSRGYQPVPPQIETNNIHEPQWLSSGPSTRPNTQPSSPVMGRKRKSEASHDPPRNGFISPRGQPKSPARPTHSRKQSLLAQVKAEPVQEPTPNSLEEVESDDDDAHAESDTEFPSRSRTNSPARPWPANRPRPAARTSDNTSTPATKSKRKSSNATPKSSKPGSTSKAGSTSRPKASKRTSSSATATQAAGGSGSTAPSRRQPLTQEQKKANHTSSEQRRRDAAAAAQARVFDLVPSARNPATKVSTVQRLGMANEFLVQIREVREQLAAVLRGAGVGGGGGGGGGSASMGLGLGLIDSTDATAAVAAGTLAEMVGGGIGGVGGVGGMGQGGMFGEHY